MYASITPNSKVCNLVSVPKYTLELSTFGSAIKIINNNEIREAINTTKTKCLFNFLMRSNIINKIGQNT